MKRLRTLALAGGLAVAALLGNGVTAEAQTPAEVTAILKKFDHEPTIRDVQEAARKYAMIDETQMEGWYTRAKIANIIPGQLQGKIELTEDTGGYDRNREDLVRIDPEDLSSRFVVDDTQHTNQEDDSSRVRYALTADWVINKLIFNSDELDVSREVSRLVKSREQVLITVTKLYYERRRLQVEALLRPSTDATEQVKAQLRIDELTADLDALTGGWFSKNIQG